MNSVIDRVLHIGLFFVCFSPFVVTFMHQYSEGLLLYQAAALCGMDGANDLPTGFARESETFLHVATVGDGADDDEGDMIRVE